MFSWPSWRLPNTRSPTTTKRTTTAVRAASRERNQRNSRLMAGAAPGNGGGGDGPSAHPALAEQAKTNHQEEVDHGGLLRHAQQVVWVGVVEDLTKPAGEHRVLSPVVWGRRLPDARGLPLPDRGAPHSGPPPDRSAERH